MVVWGLVLKICKVIKVKSQSKAKYRSTLLGASTVEILYELLFRNTEKYSLIRIGVFFVEKVKMGDASVNSTGLLPKISLLFNNPQFSDIEFVFISDAGDTHKIYGHKLILALRSKIFALQFFEKKEYTSSIRLPASKKASFELLLRYLYTDDVQFHTYEEAQDLYKLAESYDIEELYEKCYKYMLQDRLTVNNVFSNYDCALKKNIKMLLKDCRDFVCSQTQLVLKSKNFISASPGVIEDIIKQNNLLIKSELEVITAVLNWGTEDLKRKNLPCDEKSLRKHINGFMKHLRFLTLSSSEFDSFVEKYDILSSKESNVLTKKILQPQYNVNIPEDICCISNKRRTDHIASVFDQFSLDSKCANLDSPKASDTFKSVVLDAPKSVFDSRKSTIVSYFPNYEESNTPKSTAACSPKYTAAASSNSTAYDSLNSLISYEVNNFSPSQLKESRSSYHLKQTKFFSSSSKGSSGYFSPGSVSPHSKEYSFPLNEIQPCFGLSFSKDIKCSVTFKMKQGHISLQGFELKIKNENDSTNELEVFVYIKGFSEPFSQTYKQKLRNNIFTVMFMKPMILREGNKGELEVSIENLLLERCSACYTNGKPYELNMGLGFAVELYLRSNQKSDGFLFLIDKLLYTVC